MPRESRTPETRFVKLGNCLVHIDSIAYIIFSESSRGRINKAVIHLRATEGSIQTSNISYLRLGALSFTGEEAQLIYHFFISNQPTQVLF